MASSSSSTNPPPAHNPLTYSSRATNNVTTTTSHSAKTTPTIDDKRIYVGNLDPAIDEYLVLKLFEPFGKITKLDFMFHWHGPKKGTPRGYCFLEYEAPEQATAAVKQMNRKAVKLRPLSVSHANMAPPTSTDSDSHTRKRLVDPNRPTTFSLLKAGGNLKNATTNEKIRVMELKLQQMSQAPVVPLAPIHSSLPVKPPVSKVQHSSSSSSSASLASGARSGSGAGSTYRKRPY